MSVINLNVNGREQTVDVDPATPLLYVLRNELQLNAPMYGCGLGQCGACTVIMDGKAIRSCITPVSTTQGVEITTLEGLGTVEKPHPIQSAFIKEQAIQCGYCVSGIIMTAKAFVDQRPHATEAEIREALQGVLCRCGMYLRALSAVKRYVQELQA